ncbi:MAG: hypothetical protein U1F10_01525 [Burkholderiales bacterium]
MSEPGDPRHLAALRERIRDACRMPGSAADAAALRAALTARDGPLVPVVVGRDGDYDTARLVTERTLSVNTTAAGGNASLLSLTERDPA